MIADAPIRLCAATRCTHRVDPRYLFCAGHRGALPLPFLAAIREACSPGKGRGVTLTLEWLEAVADAVECLAALEGIEPDAKFRRCADRVALNPELLDAGRGRLRKFQSAN